LKESNEALLFRPRVTEEQRASPISIFPSKQSQLLGKFGCGGKNRASWLAALELQVETEGRCSFLTGKSLKAKLIARLRRFLGF
jgi:hypothetical protein